MGLSSVVGGEGAGEWAEEGVEVDAEGEGEESLGDACAGRGGSWPGDTGGPLALEGCEYRLDHEPDTGLGDLLGRALGALVPGRGDELDVDELHRGQVLAAPESPIGEEPLPG